MKKKMKRGSFIEPSKRLQFGDVVSGTTTSKAKEGDKTYSRAVGLPEDATTRKGIVYDNDGNRIGRRVAASTPKYVPDERNAGSRSKQAADYINRSRGKTKAEIAAERKKRETNATKTTVPVSARERKQNQAQGSGAKDQQGRVKPSTDSRTGKSGSNAASKEFPKKRMPAKPAPVAPIQKKGPGPIESGAKKPGLQTPKAPQTPSAPEKKETPTGNKRIDRIKRRAEKKVGRIEDRRAKRAGKETKRADIKAAKAGAKAMVREAKGKTKRQMGGLGAASMIGGVAGQAMQNSDNPTMQKIGKGLSAVSNVAGVVGGKPAAPAAAPAPAKYGKMKGKKGMMKYRPGGAKPDYLDMDKDGNKTESMKKALKDRRSRGGYGRKKK